LAFLEGASPDEIPNRIDEGVRIFGAGQSGEIAKAGRAYTGRTMPV
jgi:hypothetical protein